MALMDEIKIFDFKQLISVVAVFVSIIAPGFLLIYLFHPELIVSLDVAKIILFSSSLTMPLLAANHLLVTWFILNKPNNANVDRISVAMTVNMGAYCFAILFAYLLALDFKTFLAYLFFTDAIIVLAVRVLKWQHDSNLRGSK